MEEINNMAFQPTPPTYQGSGCSIWICQDKHGKDYLKCKILNSCIVNCFKIEDKKEVKE